MLIATFIILLTAAVHSADVSEIIFSDSLRKQSHFKIGCPAKGPLTSLSSCYIICNSETCENAKRICKELSDDCSVVVRARRGERDSLHGQVVELRRIGKFAPEQQSERACLAYGKELSTSVFADRIAAYSELSNAALQKFRSRNGTFMFLHMRKAGGK